MPTRTLRGTPASPGLAGGVARILGVAVEDDRAVLPDDRPAEVRKARGALTRAAAELGEMGRRLRAEHREEEAEIVETGVLFALDPSLTDEVEAAITDRGMNAAAALLAAAESQPSIIAALDDELLAARAADIRSLGRRAAGLVGEPTSTRLSDNGGATILVAVDLGPADVAELSPDVRAIALASGGATAHAAIVARSLGLPMVVGAGSDLMQLRDGDELVVDGTAGTVVVEPTAEELAAAARAAAGSRSRVAGDAALPAVTRDGRTLAVLANVSSLPETRLALEGGAEGVGLLRTELSFLDSSGWPTEAQHIHHLEPVLTLLRGRVATVRLLDFGADKTPPFLTGTPERGVHLLLAQPDALRAQLRAMLRAGRDTHLRILVPMVTEVSDITRVRAAVRDALDELPGTEPPQVGAMIEVPAAAAMADRLAAEVEFFSFGTNDLTQYVLGLDRNRPGRAPSHHPGVLTLIAATVAAAQRHGVVTEVCGEAASDALVMPLLVGLGVDELSVGAARVPTVREWVRRLDYAKLRELSEEAVDAAGADAVEALMAPVRELLESSEA
jgi:phosphoenolpyruvate-protein phosphotransferase